jgi:N-acetylglutamate synthase-like GNAT family acetyltransferase
MIQIRLATVQDVDWLFACCEEFAAFYDSKISLAANPTYGKQFLAEVVEKHFVRIGVKDGVRAGFIAGLVAGHHFNPDIVQLTELLWWVPQAYRHTGVGMRLFEEFVKFGEDHCNWISFTLEDNSPIKDTFLLKRGFRMKEKVYIRECN